MIKNRPVIWGMFIGPAIVLMLGFLVYPVILTIIRSFFGSGVRLFGPDVEFVGMLNWKFVFTHPVMLAAVKNNVLWVIVFTAGTVSFGMILAVLLDGMRHEKILKTVIFVPAAISMVGAAVVWKFVYAYRPPVMPQIGLLNAIVTAFGGEPVGWLIERPWINNIALITVGVWMWTGFCMIVFSAAYKNISRDLIEAARIEGASEWRIFRQIVLPLLGPTVGVVAVTMVIQVLKIFDIVFVMTNGAFGTEVIANRMYKEMFIFLNYGRASAIAVVLLMVLLPVMMYQIRLFTNERPSGNG